MPSITRFGYSEHDTFVYCEKAADIRTIQHSPDRSTFIIGDAQLMNTDDALYLINPEEKINLLEYEGFGFVINSDGELLYSMNTPVKK